MRTPTSSFICLKDSVRSRSTSRSFFRELLSNACSLGDKGPRQQINRNNIHLFNHRQMETRVNWRRSEGRVRQVTYGFLFEALWFSSSLDEACIPPLFSPSLKRRFPPCPVLSGQKKQSYSRPGQQCPAKRGRFRFGDTNKCPKTFSEDQICLFLSKRDY